MASAVDVLFGDITVDRPGRPARSGAGRNSSAKNISELSIEVSGG
jgi:hypothetical protein